MIMCNNCRSDMAVVIKTTNYVYYSTQDIIGHKCVECGYEIDRNCLPKEEWEGSRSIMKPYIKKSYKKVENK